MTRDIALLGAIGCSLTLLWSPLAFGASSPSAEETFKISYHLTLHEPQKNQILIQGEIVSPGPSKIILEKRSATLEIQALQVYDEAHHDVRPIVEKHRIILPKPKKGPLFFRYRVPTGPLGRHGHQGYLGERFGLFNGSQLFLVPSLKKGCPEVTVTFTLPTGWEVVSSWKRQGESFSPAVSEALWPNSLTQSILAFGTFETRQGKIGETLLSTSLSTTWSPSERERIFTNVSKLYHYLSELFGGSAGNSYHIVLTPLAEDGVGINANHWAFGVGSSLQPDVQRDWELLAHRIFHKFNSDPPLGMKPKERRDGWFLEGAPSFYEQVALFESGATFDPSWKWENPAGYYSISQCAGRYLWNYFIEPQKSRIPLSEDYRIENEKVLDFFHYTRAKLVAALLDREIRRVTDGKKSLKDLLAYQYLHDREQRGSFDLLQDLKEVTGHDLRSFFEAYLFSTRLLPVWQLGDEYPWGDAETPFAADVTTSFWVEEEAGMMDRLIEKEGISFPVTKEEEEGLRRLKGAPERALKAIKRVLLQLKVTGVKVNDPQKEEKLLSAKNLVRMNDYLEKEKARMSQNSGTGLR